MRTTTRARAWAKAAGYFSTPGPLTTRYPQYTQDNQISGMMQSHFPAEYAQDVILRSPNVSFQDRVRLLGAAQSAASHGGPERTTIQVKDWLPAAVGAGLGVVGAALTAPIFGLTPGQKKVYGIGAGALGAVLNTYGRD